MRTKIRHLGMRHRLRSSIVHRGLRQQAFWKEWASRLPEGSAGTSWAQCRNYVDGRHVPRLEVLKAMSEVLGVRFEWLATGEGERTGAPTPWQPIGTAPKDGSVILVADGEEQGVGGAEWLPWEGVDLAAWYPYHAAFMSDHQGLYILYRPRWWMPIPDVPERAP